MIINELQKLLDGIVIVLEDAVRGKNINDRLLRVNSLEAFRMSTELLSLKGTSELIQLEDKGTRNLEGLWKVGVVLHNKARTLQGKDLRDSRFYLKGSAALILSCYAKSPLDNKNLIIQMLVRAANDLRKLSNKDAMSSSLLCYKEAVKEFNNINLTIARQTLATPVYDNLNRIVYESCLIIMDMLAEYIDHSWEEIRQYLSIALDMQENRNADEMIQLCFYLNHIAFHLSSKLQYSHSLHLYKLCLHQLESIPTFLIEATGHIENSSKKVTTIKLNALMNMSHCYSEIGDSESALSSLNEYDALNKDDDNIQTTENKLLARFCIYIRSKDWLHIPEALENLIRGTKEHELALNAIKSYDECTNDRALGVPFYSLVSELWPTDPEFSKTRVALLRSWMNAMVTGSSSSSSSNATGRELNLQTTASQDALDHCSAIVRDNDNGSHHLNEDNFSDLKTLIQTKVKLLQIDSAWSEMFEWACLYCRLLVPGKNVVALGMTSSTAAQNIIPGSTIVSASSGTTNDLMFGKLWKADALKEMGRITDALVICKEALIMSRNTNTIVLSFELSLVSEGAQKAIGDLLKNMEVDANSSSHANHLDFLERLTLCVHIVNRTKVDTNTREDANVMLLEIYFSRYTRWNVWKALLENIISIRSGGSGTSNPLLESSSSSNSNSTNTSNKRTQLPFMCLLYCYMTLFATRNFKNFMVQESGTSHSEDDHTDNKTYSDSYEDGDGNRNSGQDVVSSGPRADMINADTIDHIRPHHQPKQQMTESRDCAEGEGEGEGEKLVEAEEGQEDNFKCTTSTTTMVVEASESHIMMMQSGTQEYSNQALVPMLNEDTGMDTLDTIETYKTIDTLETLDTMDTGDTGTSGHFPVVNADGSETEAMDEDPPANTQIADPSDTATTTATTIATGRVSPCPSNMHVDDTQNDITFSMTCTFEDIRRNLLPKLNSACTMMSDFQQYLEYIKDDFESEYYHEIMGDANYFYQIAIYTYQLAVHLMKEVHCSKLEEDHLMLAELFTVAENNLRYVRTVDDAVSSPQEILQSHWNSMSCLLIITGSLLDAENCAATGSSNTGDTSGDTSSTRTSIDTMNEKQQIVMKALNSINEAVKHLEAVKGTQVTTRENLVRATSSVLIMRLAVLSRARQITSNEIEKFVDDHRSAFLGIPAEDVELAACITRDERFGSVEAAKTLFGLAIQICHRSEHVNYGLLGSLYYRLIKLCSKEDALLRINDLHSLLSRSNNGLFNTEDIESIICFCNNRGTSLLELGHPKLAEEFLGHALNLLKYSSDAFHTKGIEDALTKAYVNCNEQMNKSDKMANTFNQVESVLRMRQSNSEATSSNDVGRRGGSKGVTAENVTSSMNSIVDSAINFAKFF